MATPRYPIKAVDIEEDPEILRDHFAAYDAMRNECPVTKSTTGFGFWVLSGYDYREAMSDHEHFTNNCREVFRKVEAPPDARLIPLQLDPPEHTKYRKILAPLLSPPVVRTLIPGIRSRCVRLIDGLADRREFDFMAEFARRFPTETFISLLGLPEEETATFVRWADDATHSYNDSGFMDYERRNAAIVHTRNFLAEVIQDRFSSPRDDIITALTRAEVDGRRINEDEVLHMTHLLYIGGLDTVAGTLGYLFNYLAGNSTDRHKLTDEPAAIPAAVEELLRFFSVTNPSRIVKEDVELGGCLFKKDERVVVLTSAMNRDPSYFDDADKVILTRSPNRHVSFGLGPHRCVGSHLARAELAIALEEWHKRIPDYRVPEGTVLVENGGAVNSYRSLPLVLGR